MTSVARLYTKQIIPSAYHEDTKMKLTISNVAAINVKQLAALLSVALDCEPSISQYEVTDSYDARWRMGYRTVEEAFERTVFERVALERIAAMTNPYDERSAEHHGFVAAQRDAARAGLKHYAGIRRYVLTAECKVPDTALFFRLAHSIGVSYRTARCTIE
jgi:hypothetical protein